MLDTAFTYLVHAYDYVSHLGLVILQSIGIEYSDFILWLFTPIVIAFLLPVFLIIMLYGCVLFLHIYKLRGHIKEACAHSVYDGARTMIASFFDAQGHEIIGFENVPNDGPALIIYYHGTLPIDIYYLLAKCLLHKKRSLRCVGDQFLFKIPGWKMLMEVFRVTPGTVESLVDLLNQGDLICISPGGVREALFSSNNYELLWGERTGFAKVAHLANVPVLPMFTENCREAFRTPKLLRNLLRGIYERFKIPMVPIYGGFPVKLRTYIGAPICLSDCDTPVQCRDKIKASVNSLIGKHQTHYPGSIILALLDRIPIWRTIFNRLLGKSKLS